MFPFDILLSLKNTVKADNKWLQPHLIRIRQLSNIKITIARNCTWTNKLKTTLPSLLLRQTFLSVMSVIRPPTPPRLRSHPLTHSVASAAGRQLSTTFPKQGMSSSIHLLRFSVFQNCQSKQPHVIAARSEFSFLGVSGKSKYHNLFLPIWMTRHYSAPCAPRSDSG